MLPEMYREAKERHPGMLLLWREGDAWNLYGDDATVAAKALELTILRKDGAPHAFFWHHQLDRYMQSLVRSGHRIALCEPC